MSSIQHLQGIFTQQDIEAFHQLPEVTSAREFLDSNDLRAHYFNIPLTPSLRATLEEKLGIQLEGISSIPMRWIRGDTSPHIDRPALNTAFNATYLVYLTSSQGSFSIDDQSFSITQNTGFIFNEGLQHETQGTGEEPRLLLGPMNEVAAPVGFNSITYFTSLNDALNVQNPIDTNVFADYTVGSPGGYTSWYIASNSSGTSPQNVAYNTNDVLNSDGNSAYYFLYPTNSPTICLAEGTQILTVHSDGRTEEYVPIESLKKGMLIRTLKHGVKAIDHLGSSKVYNPPNSQRSVNRLYVCKKEKFAEATDNLLLTGPHALLVHALTRSQKAGCQCMDKQEEHYKKEGRYRLPAYVSDSAAPYEKEGVYSIYHLSLEDEDPESSYGIYANGILVESCAKNFLLEKSGHTLLF